MPFEAGWRNLLEIVNETLVLFSSYFLFVYSDGMLLTQILGVTVKDTESQD